MSTQTFLRSFKRFAARRGTPQQVISDNAKTFVSAAQHLANLKVRWSFNLEKAPWWGGFFERMVQSVKRCLKKSIGSAKLTYDELSTALTEVEAIVNSRPISYLSSEDLEEPLTPSHLLTGHRILSLTDGMGATTDVTDEDFVLSSEDFNAKAQRLTRALQDYWIRWREEYLLQLRERYHAADNTGIPRAPILGEVVLVHDENHPRTLWKLGRVTSVITGDDGQIRGAVLEVTTNGRPSTLRRPISCLYPLEVTPKSTAGSNSALSKQDDNVKTTEADDGVSHTRPARAAAERARQQMHKWITDNGDM